MSKGRDAKKSDKKIPQKTAKEKKKAKREKSKKFAKRTTHQGVLGD